MKNRDIYRWKGQVTVFALLVFMMVVSVLASQYQSALFYACYTDANHAARLSADAFLAAYQKALRDRYGILAVDAGYGQNVFAKEKIENQLIEVFEQNMKSSLVYGQMESMMLSDSPIYTWFIDGDWTFFLREITMNQKETMLIDGIEWVIDQWTSHNDQAENELIEKKREADAAEAASEENTKEEVNEQTNSVQDPREELMGIWEQGILYAACPSGYRISDKTTQMSDVSYPENTGAINGVIDFQNEDNVLDLFEQWEQILNPEKVIDGLSQNIAVRSYIQEYFQSAAKPMEDKKDDPHALDYEVEYLIGGQASDCDNLKAVLWKLLALRCVFNLSYLMTSPEKHQQVMTTASVLSTVLWIPQFAEVTAFILKVAWAFAESLSDCRTLLNGGKVPMIKDDVSWHLTWEQMLALNEGMLDSNKSQNGWDYDLYLQVLLMFAETDTMYRRMTHLMEKNIRLMPGYEEFWMKNCIYGILVNYNCEFKKFGKYNVQSALSY